jgi:hypothetical protein
VVIKGGARGGPVALATHLLRTDTNERVTIRELSGVTARDLRTALSEMDSMGTAAESRRTLYHANIDTRIGEELTEAQKVIAVERLAAKLGMSDQARAVVEHVKHGREHLHVVFMRIDVDRMVAIPDSHNYRKHEELSRELELEFGHERVQGAHVGRDGKKRPSRTPDHSEMQQAARSGLTPQEAKARVTELWNQADTGKAFAAALENDGWILARGDKRDFVILDRAGETHSLGKRIEGAKAAQVRDRMADVDAARLPSVEEAKALYRAHENDRSQAAAPPAREPETVILKVAPPPAIAYDRPLQLEQQPVRPLRQESQKEAARVVAAPVREATQQPSVEPEIVPPQIRDNIEDRPAPTMFRQVYSAAAGITHRVLDKAKRLLTRQQEEKPAPPPRVPPQFSREIVGKPEPTRRQADRARYDAQRSPKVEPHHAREIIASPVQELKSARQSEPASPPRFDPKFAREETGQVIKPAEHQRSAPAIDLKRARPVSQQHGPVDETIEIPQPPRMAVPEPPEKTQRKTTAEIVAQVEKDRPRKSLEQLRAELDRQRSQDRDGPER